MVSNSLQNSADESSSATNKFTGCIVHVMIFHGMDISFQIITKPIVFLRYFSFPEERMIFPSEWSLQKPINMTDWILEMSLTKFKMLGLSSINEKTLAIYQEIRKIYIGRILSDSFRVKTKNINCEVNIYLHPPNQQTGPSLFITEEYLGQVIKDPFWVHSSLNFRNENRRRDYMRKVPKYSLLICDDSKQSSCYTDNDKINWISSALGFSELVRSSETLLVCMQESNGQKLYVFFSYCNPCSPYNLQLIATNEFPNSMDLMVDNPDILIIAKTNPHKVDVLVSAIIPNY